RRRRVFDRRHRGRRGTVAVCEPVRGAWAGDRLPRPVNQRLSRIECVRGVPPRLWPARSDRDSYHADCRERRARGARSGTDPVPRRQRDAGAARRRDGGDLGRESRTEPIATRAGGAAWSSLWEARGIGVVTEYARQAGLRIAAPEQRRVGAVASQRRRVTEGFAMTPFTPNSLLRPGRWVAALLMAAACTADQGVTGVSGADPLLYVLNSSGNSVTAYAAAASGDAAPGTAILGGGSSSGLYNPAGAALDTAGRLYVANCCDQVLVFAPGATGNAAPIHAISGARTDLAYPTGIAFDGEGNLYVSNLVAGPRITAYAPGAEGNIAPTDTIVGANTRLVSPRGIAFDAAGRLYVANGGISGQVLIYAPGARGNVAPIDSIAGSS